MENEELKQKVSELKQDCGCGSGKQAYLCCKKEQAGAIQEEVCPMPVDAVHNGGKLKDCCMKPEEAAM